MVEQSLIKRGYIGTCRTVDKHRIEDIHFDNFVLDFFGRSNHFGTIEQLLTMLDVNTFPIEKTLTRVGNAH